MKKRHRFRNSLAPLLLWLCLGSLVVLPIISGGGPSTLMFSEIDLENYGTFDETDTDDDFFVLVITGVTIAGPGFSKLTTINLGFPSAILPPDSPPPKHS